MVNKENIRNFSIIAHIDHGKSTLADRLLQITGSIDERHMQEQLLDNMDIERERGITIKSQAVRMKYKARDGKEYILNLIDTPGHVDFNYEVSRALAACEGAILVVDAAQGVEAQTLANVYLALENNLEILPVINKIDLPSARPDEVKREIEDVIGIEAMNAPCISAKTGLNVEDVLEDIVKNVPAPVGSNEKPLKALIFDSVYDNYKGAVAFVRIIDGMLKKGDIVYTMSNKKEYEIVEIGYMKPGGYIEAENLVAGEVGYVAASIKQVSDIRVGDTLTLKESIESSGIELIFDTDVEEKIINCDKYDIERCIVNLVSNAQKFTPKGGRISVTIKDLNNSVEITVEDTGIGIEKKYHDTIFDRYSQVVDKNNENKSGTGLGLAITKHIIDLHNGKIYLESEPNKGTKFIIILPIN